MFIRSLCSDPIGADTALPAVDGSALRVPLDPDGLRRRWAELRVLIGALGEPPGPRWGAPAGGALDDAGLIGREAELADLVESIREGRPVVVVGEAGIGKTALVRAAAEAAGRPLHEGGGFATLAWLPYLALRRATGLTETGDPSRVATVVERAVGADLLFIDDLQWTDATTQEVVRRLVGRTSLVVAIRAGDPDAETALAPLIASGMAMLRLGGLDDGAAVALGSQARPGLPAGTARRIAELAGGNPLLVEELAVHGQPSSALTRAIVGHLATLADPERRALELIVVAGRPLPARVVGPTAAGLVEQGVLRARGDDVEVRHSLLAGAILDHLDADRRRDLHARLGEIVDAPAERARHLLAAGRRAAALEAAETALAVNRDPRTRAVLLTLAAEASDDPASPYRLRAAIAHGGLGDVEQAVALLQSPFGGDDDTLARAAAALAGQLHNDGRADEAIAVIDGARLLQPAPRGAGAIELTAAQAAVLADQGRLAEAIGLVERTAASSEDPAGDELGGLRAALRLYAGETEYLPALEASVRAAIAAGDGAAAAARLFDLQAVSLALAGGRVAVDVARASAAQLETLGYQARANELRAEATAGSIFDGDLAGAVAQADTLLETPIGRIARQRLIVNRALATALLGRVDEAARLFEDLVPDVAASSGQRGAIRSAWAEACLWAGEPARAFDLADAALELATQHPADRVMPVLTRAWAAVELGREPVSVDLAVPFRAYAGAAPELRGLAALARADFGAAAAAFDEAAALWAGYHAPRSLVCRWACGDAFLQAGKAAVGFESLRAAEAGSERIGFEPLAARCRRSIRRAGERPGRAATTGRSAGPTAGLLTRREHEVLGLVERGLTNAEIARRISLGRPTVARLLSNAMLKLGAESRAQAVVLAARVVAGAAETGAFAR